MPIIRPAQLYHTATSLSRYLPRQPLYQLRPTSTHLPQRPRHCRSRYFITTLKSDIIKMSLPELDIKALAEPDTLDARIADIIHPAFSSPPTALTSEALAGDLDTLFPHEQCKKQSNDEDIAGDFLWNLWGFVIKVAKKVPAEDVRMALLVDALNRLQGKEKEAVKVWGQDCRMWKDLGLLGPQMREAWNAHPVFAKADDQAIAEWQSLNSFAARLLGQSIQTWNNFGIWELREVLEERPAEQDKQLNGLWSASEWILHAGDYLREKKGQEAEMDPMEKRMLKGGSLFDKDGEKASGLSDERWAFWRGRFEELGKGLENEKLKERVREVVKRMQ